MTASRFIKEEESKKPPQKNSWQPSDWAKIMQCEQGVSHHHVVKVNVRWGVGGCLGRTGGAVGGAGVRRRTRLPRILWGAVRLQPRHGC